MPLSHRVKQWESHCVDSARRCFNYLQGGGTKNTGTWQYLLCNDYFSTVRAATDKRSSPVASMDQVAKGWSLKQTLKVRAFKIKKYLLWESISFCLLSIPRQFFKMAFCSQKLSAQKFKHTDTYTPLSSRNWTICLSSMSKSSCERIDKDRKGILQPTPEILRCSYRM